MRSVRTLLFYKTPSLFNNLPPPFFKETNTSLLIKPHTIFMKHTSILIKHTLLSINHTPDSRSSRFCQPVCQRYGILRLTTRVHEQDSVVTGAHVEVISADMHATSDVWALLVDAKLNRTRVATLSSRVPYGLARSVRGTVLVSLAPWVWPCSLPCWESRGAWENVLRDGYHNLVSLGATHSTSRGQCGCQQGPPVCPNGQGAMRTEHLQLLALVRSSSCGGFS